MNPSQNMNIILMSWCNEMQCHLQYKTIPCPQKPYPWCCDKSDTANHGGEAGEEQDGGKEEKFTTCIHKQTGKENRFAPTGEISKMASEKRQASSFLATFCFLTQLYVHLQDLFSPFHSGSKRENTSDKKHMAAGAAF